MKIIHATPRDIQELWASSSSSLSVHPSIAQVAEIAIDCLYRHFEDSLVMIRAFLTVPYQTLPERQRKFAAEMARSVKLENVLGPYTPVHSLIAARGCVSEWNDPRRSKGHVAIPLLSESFVSSIPMMSRLLKELGLPLSWVQDPGNVMERQIIGSQVGLFFVRDAENAVDELGRKIIAAQDFVTDYSVRAVFAVGGVVFGGAVFVIIFFSRDPIESRSARAFMPLISHVKALLISRCSMSRIFDSAELPDRGGGTRAW